MNWLQGAAAYGLRAQQHRPTDPEVIAGEVRRLVATGLTERDVAVALRLDPTAVRAALSEGSRAPAFYEEGRR